MSTQTKTPDHDPAHSLNVTVGDGKYTVIQDATGRMSALRYGEMWRDCCGDGLIYTLAAEVQNLRDKLAVTDKIVAELERVLNAIPECGAHGSRCVPHAIEWIESAKAKPTTANPPSVWIVCWFSVVSEERGFHSVHATESSARKVTAKMNLNRDQKTVFKAQQWTVC